MWLTFVCSVVLDGLVIAVFDVVVDLVVVVKATLDTLLVGVVHVILDLKFTTLIATLGLGVV